MCQLEGGRKPIHSLVSLVLLPTLVNVLLTKYFSSWGARLGGGEFLRKVDRISLSLHRSALCHWGGRVEGRGLLTACQPSLRLPLLP